jgi:maleylacetate reductase
MDRFVYDQLGGRVVFGNGRVAEVGAELNRLNARRVMLIADVAACEVADAVAARIHDLVQLRWGEVVQHVPFELADRARAAAHDHGVDTIVCIGGGSATGLAKAVALTGKQHILAVPTTYAGSEQTSIYGLTGDRHKQTGKDPLVKPRTAIYDPELTVGLPGQVTGASAFNALAHSVEALYAPGCNPIVTVLSLEGVRAIGRSLAAVIADPADLDARSDLLYGAYLSGVALGATAAGLHHKICHVLGGMFDLVHADAHSVVLPHAVAFNAAAIGADAARLADALGVPGGDPAGALWDLAVASNVPTRLADLSGKHGPLQRTDLSAVAEQAAAETNALPPPGNPRPVTAENLLTLLHHAFDGTRPEPTT